MKHIIRFILMISTLLLCNHSFAAVAIQQFTPSRAIDFGTWSGTGDTSASFTACAVSVVGQLNSNTTSPYAIRAYNNNTPTAPYALVSTTTPALNIPISITHTDLFSGSSEILSPNVYTTQNKTGAIRRCPAGNNMEISVQILEANLASVPAGTYTSNYRLEILGGNGNQSRRANFSITIVIPDVVQISGEAPISLGTYTLGAGDLIASDTLCIFRSGGSSYQVTVTGSGAGGAYELMATSQIIPFQVFWSDTVSRSQTITNTVLMAQQGAVNSDNTCGGGLADNATLEVQVLEADLSAVTETGAYSGTITITIAPE